MKAYRVCGLVLGSDLRFPELELCPSGSADITLRFRSEGAEPHDSPLFYHHWRFPNGEITLSFAREGSGFWLRFPNLADFLVSSDASNVVCTPTAGTPKRTLRHLFLNQVLPLALSQQGRLILHASTIVAGQGAVAFVGPAGHGKSTLAAALAERGLPVLTDDCLLLDERGRDLIAAPSYGGIRLWPDSVEALFSEPPPSTAVAHYTHKKRLYPHRRLIPFCRRSVPLHRIFVLNPVEMVDVPAPVAVTRLSPRAAFLELVRYAYRMDVADREKLVRDVDLFGRVAVRPLFFLLTFTRDLLRLVDLRDAVLRHIAYGGNGAAQSIAYDAGIRAECARPCA